jgi:osmotically inducible protein OsmC
MHAPNTERREVIEMSAAQDRPGSREGQKGSALVVWSGDLKSGTGSLHFEQGAGGELPLLWPGSDAYGPGATTPEELTAAAHAACFTMTLAHTLARDGHRTRKITATAHATFGVADQAHATFGVADHVRVIRRSELEVVVDADGLDESQLNQAAEIAGRYCPVSNTLRAGGVELDVAARLLAPLHT